MYIGHSGHGIKVHRSHREVVHCGGFVGCIGCTKYTSRNNRRSLLATDCSGVPNANNSGLRFLLMGAHPNGLVNNLRSHASMWPNSEDDLMPSTVTIQPLRLHTEHDSSATTEWQAGNTSSIGADNIPIDLRTSNLNNCFDLSSDGDCASSFGSQSNAESAKSSAHDDICEVTTRIDPHATRHTHNNDQNATQAIGKITSRTISFLAGDDPLFSQPPPPPPVVKKNVHKI